ETDPEIFLSKDIKIIVGGTKTWEMLPYKGIFWRIGDNWGINFIMSFAPPSEFAEIRGLMGGFKTYFAEYAPYPFAGNVNLDGDS
ncbi:MAG: hypothetical protein FWD71_23185, partial [Oscillospiraceae bacterium]|nr:hypothetical protein [Oscillospiraceae bacterium]